jgi:hypothetical protein
MRRAQSRIRDCSGAIQLEPDSSKCHNQDHAPKLTRSDSVSGAVPIRHAAYAAVLNTAGINDKGAPHNHLLSSVTNGNADICFCGVQCAVVSAVHGAGVQSGAEQPSRNHAVHVRQGQAIPVHAPMRSGAVE